MSGHSNENKALTKHLRKEKQAHRVWLAENWGKAQENSSELILVFYIGFQIMKIAQK